METSTDPLEGLKTTASWVAGVFQTQSANVVRFVRKVIVFVLYFIAGLPSKLVRSSFSSVDAVLSRKGMPIEFRWLFSVLLAWPIFVVRYTLIGIVAVLWIEHGPPSFVYAWQTIANVQSTPNKKRTPQKHRPVFEVDAFDDVRARIRELSK